MAINSFFRWLLQAFIKIVVLLWLVLILLWTAVKGLVVQQVECWVDENQVNDSTCQVLQRLIGQRLLFNDLASQPVFQEIANQPEQAQAYYLQALDKKLPGTLIVRLTIEPPLYQVWLNDQVFQVMPGGQLKPGGLHPELPEVWIKSGSLEPAVHEFLVQLIAGLKHENLAFTRIDYYDETRVKVFLTNQPAAVLERSDQTLWQTHRLALILNNLSLGTIDLAIKEIDLRFKLPVLKTRESEY